MSVKITEFKKWFNNNLIVNRYPTPQECKKMAVDVIINVSDEYIHGCAKWALDGGKMYHWFPMNECGEDMGLNSIYGALQIIRNAEMENKKVFLHCHAGVCRSPVVKECYHFMRTGVYLNPLEPDEGMLPACIKAGHLPKKEVMEKFLQGCDKAFELDETMRGGQLDKTKLESKK